MSHHPRRLARLAAGLLLAGATLAGAPSTASATTRVTTFVSVDATAVGCTGVRINSIEDAAGVRYYHHGKRLHFPTRTLRFDELGGVELTARPKRGFTVTQARDRLVAPAGCFTDLTVSNEPRQGAVDSWCAGATSPVLTQGFSSESLETQTASWRLVRRADHQVVARGTVSIYLGVGPVDFPVPAGLPLGRYVLVARNTASPAGLFPYSMPVEQYRCMKPPVVRTGAAVFTVPAHGPAARIEIYDGPPQAPSSVVVVRAGHRYTYRTRSESFSYTAYANGNHVGVLGYGYVDVPQT